MKLLLDESLPRRLEFELTGHEVVTVQEQNWMGKKNGELLRLAGEFFNVFLTADQNLQYQQNLKGSNIAIVVLLAKSNRFNDLKPLIPQILKTLEEIKAGEIAQVAI